MEPKVTADEMVEELTRTIGNLHMQIAAMQILIRKLTQDQEVVEDGSLEG